MKTRSMILLSIHSTFCSVNRSFTPLGEESCTSLMEAFEPQSDSDINQLLMRSNAFC